MGERIEKVIIIAEDRATGVASKINRALDFSGSLQETARAATAAKNEYVPAFDSCYGATVKMAEPLEEVAVKAVAANAGLKKLGTEPQSGLQGMADKMFSIQNIFKATFGANLVMSAIHQVKEFGEASLMASKHGREWAGSLESAYDQLVKQSGAAIDRFATEADRFDIIFPVKGLYTIIKAFSDGSADALNMEAEAINESTKKMQKDLEKLRNVNAGWTMGLVDKTPQPQGEVEAIPRGPHGNRSMSATPVGAYAQGLLSYSTPIPGMTDAMSQAMNPNAMLENQIKSSARIFGFDNANYAAQLAADKAFMEERQVLIDQQKAMEDQWAQQHVDTMTQFADATFSAMSASIEALAAGAISGPEAARQMGIGVIKALASQARVKALYELAEGFKNLATPGMQGLAALNFRAAAAYGAVSLGATAASGLMSRESSASSGGSASGAARGLPSNQPYGTGYRASYNAPRQEQRSITHIVRFENEGLMNSQQVRALMDQFARASGDNVRYAR